MACDICKKNPPGKWYTTTCTTGTDRSVEVLCASCHSAPARYSRFLAAGLAAAAKAMNRAARAHRQAGGLR